MAFRWLLTNKADAKRIGQSAETEACAYLQRQGLTLITRNYYCRSGEIDLIMRDKTHIVFVEVRYRNKVSYGSGAESITLAKRKKLIKTAIYYLQTHKLFDKTACRFDVITMTATNTSRITWIKDAFQVEYSNYY